MLLRSLENCLTCDETLEEWLLLQIFVVRLKVLLGGRDHLQSNELVASLFEPTDDVADESTLDTIWLDSNEAGMIISRPLFCTYLHHSRLFGGHAGFWS